MKMTINDRQLVHEILERGGITLDVKTMTTVDKSCGYLVSTGIYHKQIPVREFNKKKLDEFIEQGAFYFNKKGHYLGAWVHEDIVYLDITLYRKYLSEAKWLAKMSGQKAIWDCEKRKEVFLDD